MRRFGAARSMSMTRVGAALGGGAVVASPGLGPFFDTFTGDGPISARSGYAVTTTTAQAGFSGVLSTLSGNIRSTNSAAGNVTGLHDTGAGAGASRAFYKATEAALTNAADQFEAHTVMDPTNGRTGINMATVGAVNTASTNVQHTSIVNGASTGRIAIQTLLGGQVVEHRTINDAGTMRAQLFVNGRQYCITGTNTTAKGIDIATALGRAANGKYGFGARISTSFARFFGAANSATDAWLTVGSAGGVRQTGKEFYLYGEYNGARAPLSSEITVIAYNAADDTVVSGFSAATMTSFAASGGLWVGTVANPETDNIWLEIKWSFTDTGGGAATTSGHTATIRKGDVIVVEGQSQIEFISDGGPADTTYSATSQAALLFSARSGTAIQQRYISLASAAASNWAAVANPVQAITSRPTLMVTACLGGTPYSTRNKPSAQYDATLEGIKVAGGRVAMMCLAGGTSGEVGSIVTNIIKLADDLDADLGVSQLYGIMPEGNDVAVGSSTPSTNRRGMWQLTRDYPSRFKLLGFRNELQHNLVSAAIDANHYAHPNTSTGYIQGTTLGDTEFARRIGVGVAYHVYGGPDYRGPRITNSTAPSKTATTLRIYFATGDLDGLAIANTGYIGDVSGGFEFNGASSFSGTVYTPTAVTFGTVTAGVGYVEWTFAALPATVYARCAMGDDPFNRTSVTAISQNMQARGSYLVATKTGVVPAAVWPSYDAGGTGVDYLTI